MQRWDSSLRSCKRKLLPNLYRFFFVHIVQCHKSFLLFPLCSIDASMRWCGDVCKCGWSIDSITTTTIIMAATPTGNPSCWWNERKNMLHYLNCQHQVNKRRKKRLPSLLLTYFEYEMWPIWHVFCVARISIHPNTAKQYMEPICQRHSNFPYYIWVFSLAKNRSFFFHGYKKKRVIWKGRELNFFLSNRRGWKIKKIRLFELTLKEK